MRALDLCLAAFACAAASAMADTVAADQELKNLGFHDESVLLTEGTASAQISGAVNLQAARGTPTAPPVRRSSSGRER